MKVEAKLNNCRRSASKTRETAEMIKGMDVADALVVLKHRNKGDVEVFTKLIKSAIANAQNNFNLEKDGLYITEVKVGEGMTMKRWRPRAYGRAAQILKRTCHISLTLDERSPGKKKLKKQLDKKEQSQEDSKEEKAKIKESKEEKGDKSFQTGKLELAAKQKKSAWPKKIFRRKAS